MRPESSDELRSASRSFIEELVQVTPVSKSEWKIKCRFWIRPGSEDADRLLAELPSPILTVSYRLLSPLANQMLWTQFQRAVGELYGSSRPQGFADDEDLAIALHPLALTGANLYEILFGLGRPGATIYSSDDMHADDFAGRGRLIRRWLDTASDIVLLSPKHFLPWNILYPDDVPLRIGPIDPRRFWGFDKQLHIFNHGTSRFHQISREWRLAASMETQKKEIADHASALAKYLHSWGDRVHKPADLSALLGSFAESDMIFHFGHAFGSTHGLEVGAIEYNGAELDAATLAMQLQTGKAKLPARRPLLVFLNGCSTGLGPRSGDGTIPQSLTQHRPDAFCFIAAIAAIPAPSAAELARIFWWRFLSGGSLGGSLFLAKQNMLNVRTDPVGMFYEVWGRMETQIRSADAAAR